MEVLLNQEKYTTEELSYLLPFDKAAICKFAREGYLKSAKEKLQSGRVGYVYKKEDVKTFLRDNNFYPYGNIQVIDAAELVKPITKTVTDRTNEEETKASSASIITGAIVFKKINKFGFDFTSEKSYDDNMNVAYSFNSSNVSINSQVNIRKINYDRYKVKNKKIDNLNASESINGNKSNRYEKIISTKYEKNSKYLNEKNMANSSSISIIYTKKGRLNKFFFMDYIIILFKILMS